MKGIGNSLFVQKKVGERLRAARGSLSRKQLAILLLQNTNAPKIRPRENCADSTLPEERLAAKLKQIEYGVNPIDIEWIPAICDVLHCDVGYLFGEYQELTRTTANICAETGLTEAAIKQLLNYDENVKDFISFLLSSGAINLIGLSVSQCVDTRLKIDHHKKLLSELPRQPLLDTSDTSLNRTKIADAIKSLDEVYTARLWRSGKYADTAIEKFIELEAKKWEG